MDYMKEVVQKRYGKVVQPDTIDREQLAVALGNEMGVKGHILLFSGVVRDGKPRWSVDYLNDEVTVTSGSVTGNVPHEECDNPADCIFKLWLRLQDE